MAKAVFDTSALLAYLNEEPGADFVKAFTDDALISAVNFAEAVSKLVKIVGSFELARETLNMVEIEVVDFDRGLAESAGALAVQTRKKGLSLGDRACLALASRERLPVLTGDRIWSQLDLDIDIKLIR